MANNSSIAGLREQILANAEILYPMMHDKLMPVPDLKVITFGLPSGLSSDVYAAVVYGNVQSPKKDVFLLGRGALSHELALQNILDITARSLYAKRGENLAMEQCVNSD